MVHTENGKVQIKQALNLTAFGAARGASARHVGEGPLADYGINADFIKDLGKTIPKGSSALFMLLKRSTPDKVLPELEPFKPRVLRTSLSNKQEVSLRSAPHTAQAAA